MSSGMNWNDEIPVVRDPRAAAKEYLDDSGSCSVGPVEKWWMREAIMGVVKESCLEVG